MIKHQVFVKEVTYAQTIKDNYPALDIRSTHLHTSEGQFNDILFVNDDLIFRFPRHEEGINSFLQEIEILLKLQGHLSLPIPKPIYVSSGSKAIGKLFMGYRMLTGKPLFRSVLGAIADQTTLAILAQQLAAFLHGLHSLSPAAVGLNLPFRNALIEYERFFFNIQEHLFSFMRPDARITITKQFTDYFDDTGLHDFDPALIHGDFGGSNILFEADQITGVIDFGFAGFGDPATDLAAVSTFGDSFFARICEWYSPNEAMLKRARFHRSTFALYEALHGFQNNDQEAFKSGMEQYI